MIPITRTLILAFIASVLLPACGGGGKKQPPDPPPVDTQLDRDKGTWDEKDWV